MKKLICAALAALLLLSTAACSGPETSAEPVLIGISLRQSQDSNTAQYRQYLEAGLRHRGYTPVVMDAQNDPEMQQSQVQQLLEQGCKLLMIEPVEDAHVMQWGQPAVPVMFLNSEPESLVLTRWEKSCYVGCSNVQAGAVQGQIIYDLPDHGDINGDGTVAYALLQSLPGEKASGQRVLGCLDALEKAGVKAQAMAQAVTNGEESDAAVQCGQLLSQFGKDIEVIICSADAVLGAVEAVRNGGWIPGQDIWLVGIGSSLEILEEVECGALAGTAADDMEKTVQQVLNIVETMLQGQAVEKRIYIEHVVVTMENAADFMDE